VFTNVDIFSKSLMQFYWDINDWNIQSFNSSHILIILAAVRYSVRSFSYCVGQLIYNVVGLFIYNVMAILYLFYIFLDSGRSNYWNESGSSTWTILLPRRTPQNSTDSGDACLETLLCTQFERVLWQRDGLHSDFLREHAETTVETRQRSWRHPASHGNAEWDKRVRDTHRPLHNSGWRGVCHASQIWIDFQWWQRWEGWLSSIRMASAAATGDLWNPADACRTILVIQCSLS